MVYLTSQPIDSDEDGKNKDLCAEFISKIMRSDSENESKNKLKGKQKLSSTSKKHLTFDFARELFIEKRKI